MEVYILDKDFRQTGVVDTFESLIWTERYNAAGDFVLIVEDSYQARIDLAEGNFISVNDSIEKMQIETQFIENGSLKLTGNSLVNIFKHRVARGRYISERNHWELVGAMRPGWAARTVVYEMTMPGGFMDSGLIIAGYGSQEVIPYLEIGSIDNVTGDLEEQSVQFGTVYDAVKKFCDNESLGFTLYHTTLTDTTYKLTFTVYAGRDLTSAQSTYPLVRFEPALDSLVNTKELRSVAGYKTAAYAFPATKSNIPLGAYAYVPGGSATVGFDRRTLLVEASDINTPVTTQAEATQVNNLLRLRAKNALVNNNYTKMVDGEVVPQEGFRYGIDYKLGDIVELRTPYGGYSSKARVIEYIFSSDATGEKSYPTISVIE